MINLLKIKLLGALKIAIAFTPWLISMYLLYWLGKNEIWLPETPHRDKATLLILVIGMGLSFLLQSYIAIREKK